MSLRDLRRGGDFWLRVYIWLRDHDPWPSRWMAGNIAAAAWFVFRTWYVDTRCTMVLGTQVCR